MGRYTDIQTKRTPKGKEYLKTVRYPEIPLSFSDIYVYTNIGDRFEL